MFRNTLVLMLSVLTFLVLASTFNANAVVVPNATGGFEGNSTNILPFNCGDSILVSHRYQQLYASSEFPQESCFITAVLFRQDGPAGEIFGPTIVPNTTIELSTSLNNVTNMSFTFADNVGGDVVTVFSGALSLTSSTVCGAGPCNPFDIFIDLQQGFPYDPSSGDLLLDVRIPQCVITSRMDAVSGSSVMARAFTLAGDPTDVDDPVADNRVLAGEDLVQGLVTQFVCGEPPTGACCEEFEVTDVCEVLTEDECGEGGGTYIGDGVSCEPNPCVEEGPPSGPIAIIPTMGQWGMIIASVILGFFAIIALRKRTES